MFRNIQRKLFRNSMITQMQAQQQQHVAVSAPVGSFKELKKEEASLKEIPINFKLVPRPNLKNVNILSSDSVEAIPVNDGSKWSGRAQTIESFSNNFEISFQVSDHYTFVCLTPDPTYPNRDIVKFATAGLYFDQPAEGGKLGQLSSIFKKVEVNKHFDVWSPADTFKIVYENEQFKYYKNDSLIFISVSTPVNNGPYYLVIAFNSGSADQPKAVVSNIKVKTLSV